MESILNFYNWIKVWAFAVVVAMFAAVAFAQDVTPPTGDEIQGFLNSVPGLLEAGILGSVALAIQALLLVMRSKFVKLSGKAKQALVLILTWGAGLLTMKLNGSDWGPAILHPASLAAFQLAAYAVYETWVKKEKKQ